MLIVDRWGPLASEHIAKIVFGGEGGLRSVLSCLMREVITIDVHARDVIEKFVVMRLTDQGAFQWQSQLRFYWIPKPNLAHLVCVTDPTLKTCVIRICDWSVHMQCAEGWKKEMRF